MQVKHVSIAPTEAATSAGAPALIPELLAAVAARYSRNGEGLDAILLKVDAWNQEKSIDSIFKFIDFGHQSLADNVPIAMFMDGISIFLAYFLWSECAVVGGQETSTRYVQLDRTGVLSFEDTGLPVELEPEWNAFIDESFKAYNDALKRWTSISLDRPYVMRLPSDLVSDTSDKAQKQVARMRRNYAFDRARYFLPVAALTNVMMVQSAREWARLIGVLQSMPILEFKKLGWSLSAQLKLSAPRLVKHAIAREETIRVLADEQRMWRTFRPLLVSGNDLPDFGPFSHEASAYYSLEPRAQVELLEFDRELGFNGYQTALQNRTNRYSRIGSSITRTTVRVSWDAVAMAEIRDLNRHRTGTKFCPLSPQGFYCALDQAAEDERVDEFGDLEPFGWKSAQQAAKLMWVESPGYMFWTLLGTQFFFEHTTQLDKFIYEGELRTGLGAHYRYAKHLHDALNELYRQLPELRHLVIEGSAEPE